MKQIISYILIILVNSSLFAQEMKQSQDFKQVQNQQFQDYTAFIYTSDEVASELDKIDGRNGRQGYLSKIGDAAKDAAAGIAAGYVTSFVDLGVNALASLITKRSKQKQEWETTVAAENSWSTHISTIQNISDFYKKKSTRGALDPNDMIFNGIGCIKMENSDTVFYISCHVDKSKLYRVYDHSKFQLVLDDLKFSPYHSNLPNTQLPIEYSFDERKDFNISVNIKLYSSWFTDALELHDNVQLGEFKISIPIKEEDLVDGYLNYHRNDADSVKYAVVGESFIVPRSYMGLNNNDTLDNIWGTGEYKLDIELSETCDITDTYKDNWNKDRKRRCKMRSKMTPQDNLFKSSWKVITNQHWDNLLNQWVITTLRAPASIISDDINKKLHLTKDAQ